VKVKYLRRNRIRKVKSEKRKRCELFSGCEDGCEKCRSRQWIPLAQLDEVAPIIQPHFRLIWWLSCSIHNDSVGGREAVLIEVLAEEFRRERPMSQPIAPSNLGLHSQQHGTWDDDWDCRSVLNGSWLKSIILWHLSLGYLLQHALKMRLLWFWSSVRAASPCWSMSSWGTYARRWPLRRISSAYRAV